MEEGYFYVLIPIVVGGITQATKFFIFSWKHGLNWNYFFTHGHMPSTHSAFVTSMIVATGHLAGFNSAAFLVAFSLGIIIIDDALRLRMYLGDQGRYLNMLVDSLNLDANKYPRLKERIGHRSSEVIVGLIYGLALAYGFIFLFEKLSWIA
ncbi:MAG: divergent PAP2 family protein [Candidatus Moranbacteria bacterium]|nr:divergent PAP2 family protein [Candidatus Moranbacteria bacterium]